MKGTNRLETQRTDPGTAEGTQGVDLEISHRVVYKRPKVNRSNPLGRVLQRGQASVNTEP